VILTARPYAASCRGKIFFIFIYSPFFLNSPSVTRVWMCGWVSLRVFAVGVEYCYHAEGYLLSQGSFHCFGDGEDGVVREDLWELCGWPQNSGL